MPLCTLSDGAQSAVQSGIFGCRAADDTVRHEPRRLAMKVGRTMNFLTVCRVPMTRARLRRCVTPHVHENPRHAQGQKRLPSSSRGKHACVSFVSTSLLPVTATPNMSSIMHGLRLACAFTAQGARRGPIFCRKWIGLYMSGLSRLLPWNSHRQPIGSKSLQCRAPWAHPLELHDVGSRVV